MFPTSAPSTQCLKVSLGEDVRRLKLDLPQGATAAAAYAAVRSKVKQSFGLSEVAAVALKYPDDEGDLCTFVESTIEDLAVLAGARAWRLHAFLAADPMPRVARDEDVPQEVAAKSYTEVLTRQEKAYNMDRPGLVCRGVQRKRCHDGEFYTQEEFIAEWGEDVGTHNWDHNHNWELPQPQASPLKPRQQRKPQRCVPAPRAEEAEKDEKAQMSGATGEATEEGTRRIPTPRAELAEKDQKATEEATWRIPTPRSEAAEEDEKVTPAVGSTALPAAAAVARSTAAPSAEPSQVKEHLAEILSYLEAEKTQLQPTTLALELLQRRIAAKVEPKQTPADLDATRLWLQEDLRQRRAARREQQSRRLAETQTAPVVEEPQAVLVPPEASPAAPQAEAPATSASTGKVEAEPAPQAEAPATSASRGKVQAPERPGEEPNLEKQPALLADDLGSRSRGKLSAVLAEASRLASEGAEEEVIAHMFQGIFSMPGGKEKTMEIPTGIQSPTRREEVDLVAQQQRHMEDMRLRLQKKTERREELQRQMGSAPSRNAHGEHAKGPLASTQSDISIGNAWSQISTAASSVASSTASAASCAAAWPHHVTLDEVSSSDAVCPAASTISKGVAANAEASGVLPFHRPQRLREAQQQPLALQESGSKRRFAWKRKPQESGSKLCFAWKRKPQEYQEQRQP